MRHINTLVIIQVSCSGALQIFMGKKNASKKFISSESQISLPKTKVE